MRDHVYIVEDIDHAVSPSSSQVPGGGVVVSECSPPDGFLSVPSTWIQVNSVACPDMRVHCLNDLH